MKYYARQPATDEAYRFSERGVRTRVPRGAFFNYSEAGQFFGVTFLPTGENTMSKVIYQAEKAADSISDIIYEIETGELILDSKQRELAYLAGTAVFDFLKELYRQKGGKI
jgi:hypothetical protein